MRFDTHLNDYEIPSLVDRLLAITRPEPWARKLRSLARQAEENPFLRDYQVERHSLELTLGALLAEKASAAVFPLAVRTQHEYRLFAFAAGVVRVHERLSLAGRTRLRGMLLDGLKPDNNLLSLQHEVTTAVNLVTLGFDVEFHDAEHGSGVDFIARRDGLELEVECKMFTGDLGRQIHKRRALVLHRRLYHRIDRLYQSARTGIAICVTIPDRLTGRTDQLEQVLQTVDRGLLSGTSVTRSPACDVKVLDFPVTASPFTVEHPSQLSRDAVERFTKGLLGRTNKDLMILFSPRNRAVVVLVESAKPDEVLKGIYRQLREASKGQFTRSRPGHLAVQFQDLSSEQMTELASDCAAPHGKVTGLQAMTREFLGGANRVHIHSVAYRSHGEMKRPAGQPNALMEEGTGLYTRNPANPFYDDPRLRPLH